MTSLALCIPAYNAAWCLPRLLASAHAQTVPFNEIWVYDDCSTDDTALVAERLGARVVHGLVNVGCSAGKNALLAAVGADWVHFHDADDTLTPEFVSRARQRVAECECDVLLFDYEQIDEQTGAQMSRSDFAASDLLTDPVRYMLANTVHNGGLYSVKFLRDIGGFDLDSAVLFNEDRAFHLRLAEAGARFAVESFVGSQFHFSGNSMSAANRGRCCLASFEITKRFAERQPGKYPEIIARLAWQNAACLASCAEWSVADACVELAMRSIGRIPDEASLIFKTACFLNPYLAIRFREACIRLFKPRYRVGYPAWRLTRGFSAGER